MLVLTSDNVRFIMPESVVARCNTLLQATLDTADSNGPVPLLNVTCAELAKVIEYYVSLEELATVDQHDAHFKEAFFAELEFPALAQVLNAASFLDASELVEDASAHIAAGIRGKTPAEIRQYLGLRTDMTARETAEAAAGLSWALP